MRIFIGSSSNGEDAESEAVLEYTLRKNTKRDLEIIWMRQTNDPTSFWHGFQTQNWSTPFSGFRWAIPEYCNFEGRAIYMDEDMMNFRDIGELFDMDLGRRPFAARRGQRFGGHEFCVMVIDCAKTRDWMLPVSRQKTLEGYHHRCINTFSGDESFVAPMDPRWNCLDGEGRAIEDIFHLHWTKMSTQPWKPKWFKGTPEEHPRQDLVKLFWETLEEAKRAGYVPQIPNTPPVYYNIIGR